MNKPALVLPLCVIASIACSQTYTSAGFVNAGVAGVPGPNNAVFNMPHQTANVNFFEREGTGVPMSDISLTNAKDSYTSASNIFGINVTLGKQTASGSTNLRTTPGTYFNKLGTTVDGISLGFDNVSFTADSLVSNLDVEGLMPGLASVSRHVEFVNPVLTVNGQSIFVPTVLDHSVVLYSGNGLNITEAGNTYFGSSSLAAISFNFTNYKFATGVTTTSGEIYLGSEMADLSVSGAAVPEPTSMLGLGLFAVGLLKKRKRSKTTNKISGCGL